MANALIGCTGYVGTTLRAQTSFDVLFNSLNIQDLGKQEYDTIVCAAAPAQKWIANQNPESDLANIQTLISHLQIARCRRFVLISTVDVFADPIAVDETTEVAESALTPYGRHRRLLEIAVGQAFDNHLIVRLPGLVGPGLRKNAIYDLHNNNNLDAIDARGVFQFYPMVNLQADLELAKRAGLQLLHLTSEPLSVSEVAAEAFGIQFRNELARNTARYDFRSIHTLGRSRIAGYQYDRNDVLLAVRAYHQSEPLSGASHK